MLGQFLHNEDGHKEKSCERREAEHRAWVEPHIKAEVARWLYTNFRREMVWVFVPKDSADGPMATNRGV